MFDYHYCVNTVIRFLTDNNYSAHTIHLYRNMFEALDGYLQSNGLTYSPELGHELLNSDYVIPLGVSSPLLYAAAIRKLNAACSTGSVSSVVVSSRKPYSGLRLRASLSGVLEDFLEDIQLSFSASQSANIRRRCCLFLKYLQYIGRADVSEVTYKDISDYHYSELSRLKPQSRMMEEGALCHFFRFLSEKRVIAYSIRTYMYALETDTFIDIPLVESTVVQLSHADLKTQPAFAGYHQLISTLLEECAKAGYVHGYRRSFEKALRYFELFLDINKLEYSPEAGDYWLNAPQTKETIKGSSWITARRALFLLEVYAQTGITDFTVIPSRGISGLSELPEWMLEPLMSYSELRRKEKLDDDTLNNDIYSIIRFLRFLISENVNSFVDISAETLTAFNLCDVHLSSEGKNACNARIRRFLRYLCREELITNINLEKALDYVAVRSEKAITILDPDETDAIREYIKNADSPLQLQDSAVMLLGTEMGIRGCDIVRIKIPDINFRNKTIRLIQDKTDVEIQVAMPVSVGNAIFKYLKYGRPKCCGSELLFVSLKAPYRPLSRNVCFGALRRILPQRARPGSGFHVTRKTFSTSKLRRGISPERISSALGQRSVKSLTPYLSLDGERLDLCPLSLEELDICMEGGF